MKNLFSHHGKSNAVFILAFTCLVGTLQNQLHAQDIEQDILGKWVLESTGDQLTGGTLNFLKGGTYAFEKDFADGTKAELSGGYLLDAGSAPAQLRMCLGDCDAAGSEWTSEFCIARLVPDDRLEIFMSSTGDYPGRFPKDRNTERMYVFVRE